MNPRTTPTTSLTACEDRVCMVFNDHGNAFLAFPYTPEELEAEAKRLRGDPVVTMEQNQFGAVLS